ncbi:hypothetical protein LTS10_007848 [Elasticomyces elasticus]|nr:hypothetical protein LTS10_007848 [Elasticomyces elasticus]
MYPESASRLAVALGGTGGCALPNALHYDVLFNLNNNRDRADAETFAKDNTLSTTMKGWTLASYSIAVPEFGSILGMITTHPGKGAFTTSEIPHPRPPSSSQSPPASSNHAASHQPAATGMTQKFDRAKIAPELPSIRQTALEEGEILVQLPLTTDRDYLVKSPHQMSSAGSVKADRKHDTQSVSSASFTRSSQADTNGSRSSEPRTYGRDTYRPGHNDWSSSRSTHRSDSKRNHWSSANQTSLGSNRMTDRSHDERREYIDLDAPIGQARGSERKRRAQHDVENETRGKQSKRG